MEFFNALWKYLIVSSPYLLFGLTISGIIHQFITVEKIKKWLGGNSFINVVKAAIVGIPLPLCSCSVIPTAVTLRKSGASAASTSSFLIATPESGVDSISMTYALMDLPMTIMRPVAAFISAFLAGLLQLAFNKNAPKVEEEVKSCCKSKNSCAAEKKVSLIDNLKEMFSFAFGSLINDISLWLAIGIVAGAMIDLLVPENFFLNLSPTQGRLAVFLIGVPLYICATASTPIAVSLMMKGMSPGVAMILLLVGPATNISNIAVLQKYIGKKGVILNIIAIVLVALLFSYIVDFLYANYFPLEFIQNFSSHDHDHTAWWENASAILLSVLIVKGIYFEELKPRFSKNHKGHNH